MQKNLYNQYTIHSIRFLAFTILALIKIDSLAQQKEVSKQSLYWTRYYNQLSIHPRWTWHNEIDNRRFVKPGKQHHLIIHSHIHYKLYPNLDAAIGFTYSRQNPQFPDAVIQLTVPELRPFQELNWTTTMTQRLTLVQRLRIDERFIHRNNGKELIEGYDFNFRIRVRAQVNLLLSKSLNEYATTLKVADELMVNAGNNILFNSFDQNRIYIGLEQGLGKKVSFELGYLHWYQQRNTGYQFFNRDILRLTFYHRIKLKSL